MGIAELFNTLRKSQRFNDKSSVIRETDNKEVFHEPKVLLFDFNSMIHTVSSRISGVLIAEVEGCLMQGRSPPNTASIDDVVINAIVVELKELQGRFPQARKTVLFIDGLPTYGKIIEQRSRRFVGEMLQQCRKKLLKHYKDVLNQPRDDTKGIYWNHYEYEKLIEKLRFNKSKISPGTAFMDKLQEVLLHHGIEISAYDEEGEGEMKLVQYMRKNQTTDEVAVFSPDADMVLLMLLELERGSPDIIIYRQNPQGGANHIISISRMRDVITELCGTDALDDIVVLFTVFGNDFLPGLFDRNSTRQLDVVLDAYIKTRKKLKGRGVLVRDAASPKRLDWVFVGEIISICHHSIQVKKVRRFVSPLETSVDTNKNALSFLKEVHDLEHMQGRYKPREDDVIPVTGPDVLLSYCEGLRWVVDYYVNHDHRVNAWYYPFHHAPPLPILSIYLRSKGQNLDVMTTPGLESRIFTRYLNPLEQLMYISATDIRVLVSANRLTGDNVGKIGEYAAKYLIDWHRVLRHKKGRLSIYELIDCSKAKFISKCRILNWIPMDLKEYLNTYALEYTQ